MIALSFGASTLWHSAVQALADEAAPRNVVSWLLPDNEGTIRDVVQYNSANDTTSVVDHLKFDSFGNITSQTNSANQPLSPGTLNAATCGRN